MKNFEKRLKNLYRVNQDIVFVCEQLSSRKECMNSLLNTCYKTKRGEKEYYKAGKRYFIDKDSDQKVIIFINNLE